MYTEDVSKTSEKIAWPLNDYLRKDKERDWLGPTTTAVDVFVKLKRKLVESLVVALPQPHS